MSALDEPRFDIYFTGQLVAEADQATTRSQFGQLFKAGDSHLDKVFSGKPCILKRGVDRATALTYKNTLYKIGMLVTFKAAPLDSAQPAQQNPGELSLAPVGSDVLKPSERQTVTPREIDTSNIKLASTFLAPELTGNTPPSTAPDTSHISVAEAGADLLVDKPAEPEPLALDLDAITLAPPGTDLDQLLDDLSPLDPDTSHLTLAEAGSNMTADKPKPELPPAPDTSHLSITE